jgi:hypothetical protein
MSSGKNSKKKDFCLAQYLLAAAILADFAPGLPIWQSGFYPSCHFDRSIFI